MRQNPEDEKDENFSFIVQCTIRMDRNSKSYLMDLEELKYDIKKFIMKIDGVNNIEEI